MLLNERINSTGCIEATVVLLKSALPDGRVEDTRGVAIESVESAGGVVVPVVLLRSALTPLAVLSPWCC